MCQQRRRSRHWLVLMLRRRRSHRSRRRKKKKKDGDIDRMREERRDLYDLLYGDEAEKTSDSGTDGDEDGDDEDGDDEYNDDGGTVGGLYNEDRYETSLTDG